MFLCCFFYFSTCILFIGSYNEHLIAQNAVAWRTIYCYSTNKRRWELFLSQLYVFLSCKSSYVCFLVCLISVVWLLSIEHLMVLPIVSSCNWKFMFLKQEHILETQDKAEVERVKTNVEECRRTLQGLGYVDFTFEDFFAVI